MRIMTKKAYRFTNPAGADAQKKEAFFSTSPGFTGDAPDWIASNPMFRWALDSGNLVLLASDATVSAVVARTKKKAAQ